VFVHAVEVEVYVEDNGTRDHWRKEKRRPEQKRAKKSKLE
jgi:hypothetical protein